MIEKIKKRKYSAITISNKSYDELRFISKVLNKSIVGFVSELTSALMAEAFKYQIGKGNISYELTEKNEILISFYGNSNYTTGTESLAQEAERLRKIEGY